MELAFPYQECSFWSVVPKMGEKTKMRNMRCVGALGFALALLAGPVRAGVIDWADWTASDLSVSTGSVSGVGLTFRGSLQFAQLASGNQIGGGASSITDYWIENSPAPYTASAVVDNRPPGYELLAFNAASTNTLLFSSPVTNPLMAIVSMGQSGLPVTYDFDAPFTVLSEGWGYWGDGTYSTGAGDTLTGNELHGVIQFAGTFSSLSWTSTAENWHGFTIGLAQESRIPEPATFALVGVALAGLGLSRRRRAVAS